MSINNKSLSLNRKNTAISRYTFSKPIKLALELDLINKGKTVFDYGCGRGDDIRSLTNLGIKCSGWDPEHKKAAEIKSADVVNFGYVINVIENPQERIVTLKKSWNLTKEVLIISARLDFELKQENNFKPYADGFITQKGTFQKFFTQQELKHLINQTLNTNSIPIAPGVFLAFKNEYQREEFESSIYRRRIEYISARVDSEEIFKKNENILKPLIEFYHLRGREPIHTEVGNYKELLDKFGSIKKAFSIIRRAYKTEFWSELRKSRTEDLILYLALSKFSDRPKFSHLPNNIQLDVKSFFGTYNKACSAADDMLYKTADLNIIREASKSLTFGKVTHDAVYIHASEIDKLPLILRLYEGCARSYIGAVEQANIIKLNILKPKISYLIYPQFDKDPHPALLGSMVISLSELDVKFYDYSNSNNPPILHRKEMFVPPEYPSRSKFEKLTKLEEKFDLFNKSNKIGLKKEWEHLLKSKGLFIKGHTIKESDINDID